MGVLVVSYTAYPSTFWKRSVFLSGPVCPLRLQLSAPSLPLPSRASPLEAAAPGLRGRLLSRLPAPWAVRLGCCRSDLQSLYCACWFLGKAVLLFAGGWWRRAFTLLRGKPQDATSLPSGGLHRAGQSGRCISPARLFTVVPRNAGLVPAKVAAVRSLPFEEGKTGFNCVT